MVCIENTSWGGSDQDRARDDGAQAQGCAARGRVTEGGGWPTTVPECTE